MIIMVAVGMVFAIVQEGVYLWWNRRVTEKHEKDGGEKPWLYVL